ncbi:MAG: helix-turn-helix domain-containing protein [Planctomycetota bacterium]|nr:helix-turn-helix domain-containing protein [Planctomycetota bacterium]
MSRFELRIIQQALEATNGNRAEAARRLGISRARLLRRIDSLKAD